MNVLSLFDGMSCGQIALNRAGINYDKYYSSEIDKHAIKVTQTNFPNTIQLGDVLNIKASNLPTIDLLIGGSPCQGFSSAGKRLNFDDSRSKLFFEFVRIMKECKPKYFLLENVKMKKEYENIISDFLGVQPININSALVSAQNRKRLYWTNIPNVSQPEDRKITWGDIREIGVERQKYYYTEKSMQWFDKINKETGKTFIISNTNDKIQILETLSGKEKGEQRFFGIIDCPIETQAIAAMRGRYVVNGKQSGQKSIAGLSEQYLEFKYDGKSNTLTTVSKDNVVVPFTLPNKILAKEFFFRNITPLECERLQTVPDNYTSCVSDSQRYRMLGNGWTVEVIAHIFKNII
jgi:DNA-cytosine methyltransferase